jgi:hypothetical protein
MATRYNSQIVKNGLVFCLDANNPKSYVGSGTAWNDVSRNATAGTLTNSPTYGNGAITFNGTNNYVDFGAQTLGLDLISKTACAWIKKTASSAYAIIDKDFDIATYGGWGFWIQANGKLWWWNHSSQDILDNGSNAVSNGVWAFVAVSYNSSTKTASFYINGALNSNVTNAVVVEQASTGANLLVGGARNGNLLLFNGSIANAMLYNRNLAASEILQNYNATRRRFGL